MDKNMDELEFECSQQTLFLQKKKQNKQGWNNLCWFLSKQFDQWNVQITFQNHTSYFLNMKYVQILQHLNDT
jgi:hypothetical protein